MPYSQALRPLAVETPLGPDVLLLAGVRGTEAISEPFHFVLALRSEDPEVAIDTLVGKPACVTIMPPSGEARCIHGIVRRVREVGRGAMLARYEAELVPWLWTLSLSTDCRIFQQQTVPEIVTEVFQDLGHTDYELRLVRTYPRREYCVQYRETHLDFVSRLLEDEGIAYHFVHEADKHTLVLTDSRAGARPCPGLATLGPVRQAGGGVGAAGDTYTELALARAMQPRAVALADYDYLHPSAPLASTMTGAEGVGEAFDYPGGYVAAAEGDRYARLRLEAADAQRETAEGASGAASLTSGHQMTFDGVGPGAGGRTWLVTRVTHEARQSSFLATDSGGEAFHYTNAFTLASADLPWRPPRRTVRPRVSGTQSALVVGKSGEEIWTDTHGRVKLHFYWDRRSRRDENSSCWVRCASAWAGRGYGQFSVPRMGQEVIVDFLEGDPDRPVVVGRVYNADQPPPCDPGGSRGVVSGMRSKTHQGGGYNAMELDDTAGKEKIAIHAQFDMTTVVGHDDTQTVANNRTITVGAKHTETITGDTAITVSSGTYSLDVAAGTATTHVAGTVSESFDATQETTVASDITIVSTGGKVAVTAASELTLTVGAASLHMTSGGAITLKGTSITIDGSQLVDLTSKAQVSADVGSQALKLSTGAAELSGAVVKSAASGVNEITGATVKLN